MATAHVQNADGFAEVRCFATREEACAIGRQRRFICSLRNAQPVICQHVQAHGDAYVVVTLVGLDQVDFPGSTAAAQQKCRSTVERAGNRVWLKRRHISYAVAPLQNAGGACSVMLAWLQSCLPCGASPQPVTGSQRVRVR